MEIILLDETSGRMHRFDAQTITIGRTPHCDLMVISHRVSRVHSELRVEGEKCFLVDLKSHNGTFADGVRVPPGQRVELHVGMRIQLGRSGPAFIVQQLGVLELAPTGALPTAASDRWRDMTATTAGLDTRDLAGEAATDQSLIDTLPPNFQVKARPRTGHCLKCGVVLRSDLAFCRNCGAPAEPEEPRRNYPTATLDSSLPSLAFSLPMTQPSAPPIASLPDDSHAKVLQAAQRGLPDNFLKSAPPPITAPVLAAPPVVSAPPVAMPPAPIVSPPTAVHAPMSSPNPGPAAKSGGSLKVMLGGLGMLTIAGIVGAATFIMLQRFQAAKSNNLPGDNGGPAKLPAISGSWVLWAQLLGVTAFLAGSIWGTVILARVMRRRKLEKRRRKLQEQSVPPQTVEETVTEAPPAPPAIVSDTVDCTVYAPSQASRGASLMVQVFAHLTADVGLVRQLAQRFDATAQERGFTSLAVEIARGARLDMHLALPGLTIENPVASLIWRGTPNSVQFGVYVPPEQDLGTIIGTVTVSLSGVPLGHIKFKLDIIAAAAALPPVAQPVGHSHAYRRAFVSFAESDRDEAARRVQVLAGAKIDVKPLNWEAERQNESMRQALIDDSDLFLLCWSDAARKSPQVRQELEYALQRKQGQDSALPEILPVPLQGPPVPAPPLELSYLHFEDYLPYGKSPASSSSAPTILTSGHGFVTAPALADVRGQLVKGRYEVGELLGSGGFGAAYRAADISLARRAVVVKVLHQEGLRNAWAVQKFRHEIEALARLNHPGVVGIFDAGQLPDERPFLVLQHVEGQTLRDMLGPAGLPLGEVSDIIRQSGDALAEAHHKGILHRDLKPENIMLRQLSNGALHVVVIDFGIAKVRNAVMAPVTEGEHVSGTYLYMSPEQLLGEPLNAASDVFALGVIAYELVTGQRPFNPSAIGQLPAFHRQGAAALPCDLRPELPPAAQLVMLKALAYRPAERYQNASVFGQELANALQI